MNIIVNQLYGMIGFTVPNFNLKNCVFAASLLITTPAYALDGEGWGAIIKA